MQLHELKTIHPREYKKTRVGRGGKRGTTGGRGTKGQRSRAGHRIRPAERDYIQRLPKLRGSGSRRVVKELVPLSLGRIARRRSLMQVTPEALEREGLVRKGYGRRVKILGSSKLDRKISVRGVSISASARASVQEAGGIVH